MKKMLLVLQVLISISCCSFSQGIGIGTTTPDASAALDITDISKGLLIPRMTITSINAIANPARGLLVYDSTANQLMVNMGRPASPNWQPVATAGNNSNGWNLTGNNSINAINNFIGNTDNQPLRFRVNNILAGELHPVSGNISWGLRAGAANTAGFSNIAIGTDALKINTEVANLVAIGDSALFNNGQGKLTPVDATGNTAIGSKSLFSNTTGADNTATGTSTLFFNTTGFNNTAYGSLSLRENTTGIGNTASGSESLFRNNTGSVNTAVGDLSLAFNKTGNNNTAAGVQSLFINTGGDFNTAIGGNALSATTASSNNTVVGYDAAFSFNLGSGNTIIGAGADAQADGTTNSVAIGKDARITADNQVRLGNSLTTSIGGVVGFSNLSDGRYKRNVQEGVKGIDFIMKLRPVTYQLDITGINKKLHANAGKSPNELQRKGMAEQEKIVFSGFVAQEVEQAAGDVGYNFSGIDKPKNENDVYGLRYSEFVVPLVKAIQEQQQIINELKAQNASLQKRMLILEKKQG